jgi:hypothetical protein
LTTPTTSLIKGYGMPLIALETCYLHVYNVESGSWVSLMLDSPVSPHIVEAMNLILSQDGILAYIDTRSESGVKFSRLINETGRGIRPCWISLPASTVMSMLGLCLNAEYPESQKLTFYGSPSTLVLAYILELKSEGKALDTPLRKCLYPSSQGYMFEMIVEHGNGRTITQWVSVYEYNEALSYFQKDESDEDLSQEARRQIAEQGL